MLFKEVVGQTDIKSHLIKVVNQNRLAHAYLLTEKEGEGALSLALAFAQYINCENRNEHSEDSCGQCDSCYKISNTEHVDVKFTYPVFKKDKDNYPPISMDYFKEWQEILKSDLYFNTYDWLKYIGNETKQGNIFSAECAEIIQNFSRKNFSAKYKIQIIWQANYLEKEGNKLLKLIEEPSPNAIFILITDNKELILPTILSRVQEIKLNPLSTAQLEAYISTKTKDNAKIEKIKSLCNHSLRKVNLLLDSEEDEQYDVWLNKMLSVEFNSNMYNITGWLDYVCRKRKEFTKQFLVYCITVLESCIVNQYKHIASSIKVNLTLEQISHILKLMENSIFYIERNGNDSLCLHAMLIQIKYILRDNKVIVNK